MRNHQWLFCFIHKNNCFIAVILKIKVSVWCRKDAPASNFNLDLTKLDC